MANDPTISWIAVSRGPPHLPLSRRKMKLKRSGANVPVQPAVKILSNCAIAMVKPNEISISAAQKARLPSIKPIPAPKYKAAPNSVTSQCVYEVAVTWRCEMARVVSVLAWRPTLPEIALVKGKNPINSWYRRRPTSIHKESDPPEIISKTGISRTIVTIRAMSRSGIAADIGW